MKKIFALAVCIMMAAAVSLSASAAGLDSNKQKVLDALKTVITVDGKEVSLPQNILNQAENYLKRDDVTITAAQADTIVAQIDDAVAVVKDGGVTKMEDLSVSEKTEILEKIQTAAAVINLTISVDSSKNTISVLADGKMVATDEFALKVTGPNSTSLAIFVGAGLSLIAGCFVVASKAKLFSK